MVGHHFMWEKSRDTHRWVEEKLDRALANLRWIRLFPSVCVLNEDMATSNHSTILLVLGDNQVRHCCKFRFENAWIREAECRRVFIESYEASKDRRVSKQTLQEK